MAESHGRRVLCSLAVGPQARLLRVAQGSFARYADRHGYELDLRRELLDSDRPAPWSKVLVLRELLATHELVLWIDADAVVVDPARDIADDLGTDDFMGLVEHTYDGVSMPNTGVLVLRRGETAREFLDAVWDSTDLVDHQWWENAAVMRHLGYDLDPPRRARESGFRQATTFLPKAWNSIRLDPAENPRIRHYPGYSTKTRLAFMLRDVALNRISGI
jgi:hypothetical protein